MFMKPLVTIFQENSMKRSYLGTFEDLELNISKYISRKLDQ
jgi:hypothetical protein